MALLSDMGEKLIGGELIVESSRKPGRLRPAGWKKFWSSLVEIGRDCPRKDEIAQDGAEAGPPAGNGKKFWCGLVRIGAECCGKAGDWQKEKRVLVEIGVDSRRWVEIGVDSGACRVHLFPPISGWTTGHLHLSPPAALKSKAGQRHLTLNPSPFDPPSSDFGAASAGREAGGSVRTVRKEMSRE